MEIKVLRTLTDNFSYLLADGNSAVVVDPSEAMPLLGALGDRRLETVLITHHHPDHTAGCLELKKETGCRVLGPSRSGLVDAVVEEGAEVSCAGGRHDFYVMEIPGHTADHVAFYSPELRVVFTGDTLFACGCGRVLSGRHGEMWRSLKRLRDLPGETMVYCGHDYTLDNVEFACDLEPGNVALAARLEDVRETVGRKGLTVPTSIELENSTNPFLRCDTTDVASAVGLAGSDPQAVFAEVRRRKDAW